MSSSRPRTPIAKSRRVSFDPDFGTPRKPMNSAAMTRVLTQLADRKMPVRQGHIADWF